MLEHGDQLPVDGNSALYRKSLVDILLERNHYHVRIRHASERMVLVVRYLKLAKAIPGPKTPHLQDLMGFGRTLLPSPFLVGWTWIHLGERVFLRLMSWFCLCNFHKVIHNPVNHDKQLVA